MRFTRITGLVLLATAIIGCSDADPVQPDPDLAAVVIANVASGTSDLDVEVAGLANPVALGLDFGFYTSQCALLPAEQEISITFRSSGTVLATEDVTLEDAQRYTILLTSDGTNEHVLVLEDDVTVPDGQRAVRLVNATEAAGDVYLFASGAAMGTAAATDLAYAGTAATAPQYLLRAENQTQVRFFAPGVGTGTPRAENALPAATVAPITTVIFADALGSTEVFVLGPCS